MKRMNDVIRLLLSFLASDVFRNYDAITGQLRSFMGGGRPSGQLQVFIAAGFPFVIVWLYLKNIHANIVFDVQGKATYEPWLARHKWGNFATATLAVLSLVLLPYATEHLLEHHLYDYGNHHVEPYAALRLGVYLTMPFLLFALWDSVLVLKRNAGSNNNARLHNVLVRWVRLEMIVCISLAVVGFGAYRGSLWRPDYMLLAYMVVIVGFIFGDYYWNREFYWGTSSETGSTGVRADQSAVVPVPALIVPAATAAGETPTLTAGS